MLKVLLPGGWDFDAPQTQLVKLSRQGLIGDDLRQFVKRAGHRFVDTLKHVKLAEDEVPVHLIAIGATEVFGANRNGDGFGRDTCRKYHDTFVKHARAYRNHANKDPDKSYGRIIDSMFNEDMGRIELLIGYNGSEKTARVNGGLVADKELAKLAADEPLSVSMACTVPFDRCSGCGNEAPTREQYCTARTCKYGGLQENITKVAQDGHVLYADNPDPRFFDISNVHRPADRTAYALGRLHKAASGVVRCGAQLAEDFGLTAPMPTGLSAYGQRQWQVLCDLAEQEKSAHHSCTWDHAHAYCGEFSRPADLEYPGRVNQIMAALAQEKVALPVREFLQLFSDNVTDDIVGSVQSQLPGIYGRLSKQADCEELLSTNPYDPSRSTEALTRWARELADDYAVTKSAASKRAMQAVVQQRQPQVKLAAVLPNTKPLAEHYALYKLALLTTLSQRDPDFSFTTAFSLRQNHVT